MSLLIGILKVPATICESILDLAFFLSGALTPALYHLRSTLANIVLLLIAIRRAPDTLFQLHTVGATILLRKSNFFPVVPTPLAKLLLHPKPIALSREKLTNMVRFSMVLRRAQTVPQGSLPRLACPLCLF